MKMNIKIKNVALRARLFHREDLGPVTLIFLDTNKGAKGKNKDSTQDGADHTLNVYDLGSGGDGLRGTQLVDNPYEVFRAFADSGEKWENGILVEGGCHYGFMEVDVTTNKLGKWTCSLTPCYDFINQVGGKAATFELRRYKDRIIIDEESNKIIYQEWKGDRALPENHAEYVRPPEGPSVEPPPPYERVKPYVRATWSRGEMQYRRVEE